MDVNSGDLQILEPELSVYARPTTTESGAIVFDQVSDGTPLGNTIWRAGETTPIDFSGVPWAGGDLAFFHPALSHDETKVAGVRGSLDEFEPYTFGYIIADLEQRTAQLMHAILPVRIDANLDWASIGARTVPGWPSAHRAGIS